MGICMTNAPPLSDIPDGAALRERLQDDRGHRAERDGLPDAGRGQAADRGGPGRRLPRHHDALHQRGQRLRRPQRLRKVGRRDHDEVSWSFILYMPSAVSLCQNYLLPSHD